MKNLFIDSNIWLSLYHFTNDDLEQFSKLQKLNGIDIKLLIPQQVYDEVNRNRERKLKEALKLFEITSVKFPVFCKEYEEYNNFTNDYKDLVHRHKEWKEKINRDIQNKNLPADKTIHSFFNSTELLECDSIIEKAYMRYRIGNPPGKDNKYGVAVNWKCLLNTITNGEDLYFISSDKDYRSEIFEDNMNPFLENEWKNKKKSNIYFYKNLVSFLNEHVKDIKLRTEQEKQDLIVRLNKSYNFERTHGIIAMLNKYTGWTELQIEEICQAAENNDQVKWILEDTDVYNFYHNLLSNVKYDNLTDCATKRVIEQIDILAAEKANEGRTDYEAYAADTLEEYYKH